MPALPKPINISNQPNKDVFERLVLTATLHSQSSIPEVAYERLSLHASNVHIYGVSYLNC